MFGGQKAAILAQVGHFYFGRWVSFTSAATMGTSEATFYVWRKKYADLGVGELRQLRQLTEENARLKRIVADLTLDKQILQEVIKKKI